MTSGVCEKCKSTSQTDSYNAGIGIHISICVWLVHQNPKQVSRTLNFRNISVDKLQKTVGACETNSC